jgi:ectoine hydroxylase-related dioxygenase (phytanoyl-CoA dioxygenase family)
MKIGHHRSQTDPVFREHACHPRIVAVPLPRGSVVFFPGHMLHHSGNNRSDRKRHAFVVHYAGARSRWLWKNDPNYPFLLVARQEYPGGL